MECHTWDSAGCQVTSKSFDNTCSPKRNLYQLRTVLLAPLLDNCLLYVYWGDRFLVPKHVLLSYSTQSCYSFSYTQQLLSQHCFAVLREARTKISLENSAILQNNFIPALPFQHEARLTAFCKEYQMLVFVAGWD